MEAHTEADAQTYGNSIAGNKGHPHGEGNLYDGIYREAPPERGRDFTCCEVCERVAKTVISVGKKAQEC